MARAQTTAQKADAFIKLDGKFEGSNWIVWKFVTKDGFRSPNRAVGKIKYTVGEKITDRHKANVDPSTRCGRGLNTHAQQPTKTVLRANRKLALLECRVAPKDIACIPTSARRWGPTNIWYADGPKIRVQAMRVIAAYAYNHRESDGLRLLEMANGYELIPR